MMMSQSDDRSLPEHEKNRLDRRSSLRGAVGVEATC